MAIRIRQTDLRILNMRTRFPFRYGIASLEALPHLFLHAAVEIDGQVEWGVASDGLPPRWFTKNPDATPRQEIDQMLRVIAAACAAGRSIGPAATVFDLWQEVYMAQMGWAVRHDLPPLLWGLGVSLVERAVIDAFCRIHKKPFETLLRDGSLGILLGEIHGELEDFTPADLLPPAANRRMIVRHTVGLADPIRDSDIGAGERVDDGLPQSLQASIQAYGLTHFKIKLTGQAEHDIHRLRQMLGLFSEEAGPGYRVSLDGNEHFTQAAAFREYWRLLKDDRELEDLWPAMLYVEQPIHREAALSGYTEDELLEWDERPPMIIDESDDSLDSIWQALETGYVGVSHKNCKGVIKGIAAACLLEHHRRTTPEGVYMLSGEDLASVGPVAMLQDLAVAANLGLSHVERNGHHYFAGLSMYPEDIQQRAARLHPDLYRPHVRGLTTLDIRDGSLNLDSVIEAPFGFAGQIEHDRFTAIEQWQYASLTTDADED